jgi:hypothetical protein
VPGIGVVISTHESVSYAIGYRRGRRGILIKCPWWADMMLTGSRRWMVTELTSARTMNGPRTWNQLRDRRQFRRLGTSKA